METAAPLSAHPPLLFKIPTEVFAEILQYLHIDTIRNFDSALVNRAAREQWSAVLARTVLPGKFYLLSDAQARWVFKRSIQYCSLEYSVGEDTKHMLTGKGLQAAIKNQRHMEKLSVEHSDNRTDLKVQDISDEFLSDLPRALKSLDVSSCNRIKGSFINSLPAKLHRLNLDYCSDFVGPNYHDGETWPLDLKDLDLVRNTVR
jgi:hypothetical protein